MSENKGFSERERKILLDLFNSIRPLSSKKISNISGYAWETCVKILNELAKHKYVIKIQKRAPDGRKFTRWKFNYELKWELKRKIFKNN